MKVIGIEIDNDRAIFFALEKAETDVNNITNNFKQLKLNDDKNNSEILKFQSVIFSHFNLINPDRIAILSRQGKGHYASSSISFKIEALTQCYSKKDIEFVLPQAITSYYKKNPLEQIEEHIAEFFNMRNIHFLVVS
jgi:hypothetical protein